MEPQLQWWVVWIDGDYSGPFSRTEAAQQVENSKGGIAVAVTTEDDFKTFMIEMKAEIEAEAISEYKNTR